MLAEDGEEDARISLMINPEAVVGAEEIAFLEDAGTWGPRVALDASLDDKISGSMDKIVLWTTMIVMSEAVRCPQHRWQMLLSPVRT